MKRKSLTPKKTVTLWPDEITCPGCLMVGRWRTPHRLPPFPEWFTAADKARIEQAFLEAKAAMIAHCPKCGQWFNSALQPTDPPEGWRP